MPASTSPGSSILIPRTPAASAIAAKFGFLKSVPNGRNSVDFCSSSMKPSAPLLNTTTFTGRPSCPRLRKSPISIENPPSPDSEIVEGFARLSVVLARLRQMRTIPLRLQQRQQGGERCFDIADHSEIDRG